MKKVIVFGLLAGILALAFLQSAGAYASYDYSPRYGGRLYVSWDDDDYYDRYDYGYGERYYYDYDPACKYWDGNALKWRNDKLCEWIENGDGAREEQLRYNAVAWQGNSYDWRYNIQSGRSSGDAFYYHYEDKSETSPSDWRYKTAFDPRVDNTYVKGDNYYYYQPRYDSESGTWNWRF
ncbi:MAG: hypothetical protein ACFFDT_36735 [Candidatus Hodarchaeota archaeon]